jgi:hypothetical protein
MSQSADKYNLLLRIERKLMEQGTNMTDKNSLEEFQSLPLELKEIHDRLETEINKHIMRGAHQSYVAARFAVINNQLLKIAMFLRLGVAVGVTAASLDSKMKNFIHWCTSAEMVQLLASYGVDIFQRAQSGVASLRFHLFFCMAIFSIVY